jgi:hypothetical protein
MVAVAVAAVLLIDRLVDAGALLSLKLAHLDH